MYKTMLRASGTDRNVISLDKGLCKILATLGSPEEALWTVVK